MASGDPSWALTFQGFGLRSADALMVCCGSSLLMTRQYCTALLFGKDPCAFLSRCTQTQYSRAADSGPQKETP